MEGCWLVGWLRVLIFHCFQFCLFRFTKQSFVFSKGIHLRVCRGGEEEQEGYSERVATKSYFPVVYTFYERKRVNKKIKD